MVIALLAAASAAASTWCWSFPRPAVLRLQRLQAQRRADQPYVLADLKQVWRSHRSRRRHVQLRRTAVIEICDGIGAELAAGRSPEAALAASAAVLDASVAAELLNAALVPDADIPAALSRSSELPGAEGMRLLAACWRIGAERGGTFAPVLDGLAVALRDEEAQREEIASQLAGPRATARLLAGLPILGLAMAAALGAHPLTFLFVSLPGVACLLIGIGLDALGLWWTTKLATTAERQS